MPTMLLLAIVSATLFTYCNGAIHQTFGDLPSGLSFDFVVIGGGLAGSVVASRLSENPHFKVLVLEAGPTNEDVIDSEVPLFNLLIPSRWKWNFTTVPQAALNNRVLDYPRGYLLGGSSSINGMVYTRGSSADFNRFANITGDSGWAWDNILPYFLKSEKWVPPADHHNTTGQFNPAFHNLKGTGVTSVSLPGFKLPIDGRVLQTTKEFPDEFPFTLDYNDGTPLGIGYLQSTIGNGTRSSAATAYLNPSVVARPNLEVVLNTNVTRVLQDAPGGSFAKVELRSGSKLVTVSASKEIVLSAGSIMTPHILLNSGIGDKAELAKIGIPSILDIPSVGKNLSDHPQVAVAYFVNSNNTVDTILDNSTLLAEFLNEWQTDHTGPLVNIGVDHLSYSRIAEDSPIFKKFSDPSPGKNSPHFEFAITNGGGFTGLPGHLINGLLAALTPISRGTVSLKSNDPSDPPLVDPNFLASEFDLLALKDITNTAKKFFSLPPWKGYILQPAGAFANTTTDQELEDFILNTAFSAFHPVGTASMSPKNAKFGVVDPDLKVKGTKGLRIVDASVMPIVPAAHTQAGTYAISERASDLIKSEWQ